MYLAMILGLIWLGITHASVFPVYVRPVGSDAVYEKGILTLDDRSATYEPSKNPSFYTGPACIGIMNEDKQFRCFSLADILPTSLEKYVVYISGADFQSIDHFDYTREPSTVDDSQVMLVTERTKGPIPPFKKPIIMVNGQIPEQETEKTFLQKYWIYIIPLVFMFLVTSSTPQQ